MQRETRFFLLVALFVASVIAANLMGNKIADFGFFDAAVGILVFPLSYLALDVIQEVEGRETARRIVLATMAVLAYVLLVTFIATQLPSATRDFYPEEYNLIFGISVRVMVASLTAFLVAELLDIEVFRTLKEWTHRRMLWLRATGSTIVSQFIDTTVFMFLAFYGVTPKFTAAYIFTLVIPYWLLKCTVAIFGTPFVYLGVRWLGPREPR
ncbi:MAG: queuosine precursor transporter [Methanomicrobiales archaeon]|nr:queuosine precursor transporter [Methanomicrobiales archaeon]MDD1655645.1 queuosine precursor transporter [Methanomicrobiales archaeon]